jgi:hypothetical protein
MPAASSIDERWFLARTFKRPTTSSRRQREARKALDEVKCNFHDAVSEELNLARQSIDALRKSVSKLSDPAAAERNVARIQTAFSASSTTLSRLDGYRHLCGERS